MKSQPEERQVNKRRMPHENFNQMREFDDSLDPFNDHYDIAKTPNKRSMAFDCSMLSKVVRVCYLLRYSYNQSLQHDCHRMLQRIFGPPGPFGYLHM